MIKIVLIVVVGIMIGVPLYALPATLSLPRGIRPDLQSLTISQAAMNLRESVDSGMELVEAARSLVAERMAYSRRNSFDSYARAFERGYGYCSQQANALADLLSRLGFEAKVVQAFRNRFFDASVDSHAWVQVVVDNEVHDIDSIFYDADTAEITFTALSEVGEVPAVLRVLETWGAPAVNAHRYYLTGKDQDW